MEKKKNPEEKYLENENIFLGRRRKTEKKYIWQIEVYPFVEEKEKEENI